MSLELLQHTVGSLFKRKGKDIITSKELELLMSMELRWFEPGEARKLCDLAVKLGILDQTKNGLAPKFDLNSMDIPLDFKPPENLITSLEDAQESLFIQVVNSICVSTDLKQEQVIAEINRTQADLNDLLSLEVLAILYAKEKGVDVDEYITQVKNKLVSDSK